MQAVGIGGIAVGQVVDLAIGAGATILVKTRTLQGLDIATQVVSEVFVVVVGAGDHTSVGVVVEGGGAQAAEVVVAVRYNGGFPPTYPVDDLADVACFLGGGGGQARNARGRLVVAEVFLNKLFIVFYLCTSGDVQIMVQVWRLVPAVARCFVIDSERLRATAKLTLAGQGTLHQ